MHNKNKDRPISEQSGPFAANWNTKFLFYCSQKEQLVSLLSFQEQLKGPFSSVSIFPVVPFEVTGEQMLIYFLARHSKEKILPGISAALRTALFPFGSNMELGSWFKWFLFIPNRNRIVPNRGGCLFLKMRVMSRAYMVTGSEFLTKDLAFHFALKRNRLLETIVHHLLYTSLSKHTSFNN